VRPHFDDGRHVLRRRRIILEAVTEDGSIMGAGPDGSAGSPPKGTAEVPEVYDRWQKEWADCRATLQRFDGYLDPLRKQGFSFVSALLTTTGLLSTVGTTSLTPWVKAAILAVTQGLIVALGFLEMDYRLMEKGAAARARILEARLNLAETDTMTFYYNKEGLWKTDLSLNMGFVGLTAGLGAAILVPSGGLLQPFNWPFIVLLAWSAVAFALIYYVSGITRSGGVDFGVDKLFAAVGEPVTFTVTNLYPLPDDSRQGTAGFLERGREAKSGRGSGAHPTTIEPARSSDQRTLPKYRFQFHLFYALVPPLTLKSDAPSTASRPTPPRIEVTFPDQRPLGEFDAVTWVWDTTEARPGIYHWTLEWDPPGGADRSHRRAPNRDNWVDIAITEPSIQGPPVGPNANPPNGGKVSPSASVPPKGT